MKAVIGAIIGIVVVIALVSGSGNGDKGRDDTPTAAATSQTTTTRRTAHDKLVSALREDGLIDHPVVETLPDKLIIWVATPSGGFDGASTGDLNRQAMSIFSYIYGGAGYSRASLIVFRGGLVDSATGKDLPDAQTGRFEMSASQAADINWADSDSLYSIDWTYYRTFASPALKQDD